MSCVEYLNELPRSMFTAFRCFTGQCETIEGASRSWDLAYIAQCSGLEPGLVREVQ